MNGNKYLLDTCFILEMYRANTDVLAVIQDKQIKLSQCAISFINRLEVLGYSDITPHDEIGLIALLAKFEKLPVTLEIENKGIELRKNHKIKLPDCIVLATALTHGLQLLTLDEKLDRRYQAELAGE